VKRARLTPVEFNKTGCEIANMKLELIPRIISFDYGQVSERPQQRVLVTGDKLPFHEQPLKLSEELDLLLW
jgi:hypothetical protein